jgi:hypothetical protein
MSKDDEAKATPALKAGRKVRERRAGEVGFSGRPESRVRELAEGEAVPEGAETTNEAPHDWRPEGKATHA